MNHFSFELALIAMIPGFFLCGYIFYKDRVEREPISLLAVLFGAGAVAYVPSHFLEKLLVKAIDSLFANSMQLSVEGIYTYNSIISETLHNVLCAFFGFALVPIFIKFAVLYFATHNNKNFNYLFDGVVYSVFVSLGFAMAENAVFAIQNDVDLIIPKALTSVSCNLFVAIIMGYFYTMWHMRFTANRIESKLLKTEIIKEDKIRSSTGWLVGCIAASTLFLGLYNLASFGKNQTVTVLFYVIIYTFYGLSFVIINHVASKDTSAKNYLCKVIAKSHPELSCQQIEDSVLKGADEI